MTYSISGTKRVIKCIVSIYVAVTVKQVQNIKQSKTNTTALYKDRQNSVHTKVINL